MAVQIEVAGPILVKIDAGDGLESLGVSLDEIVMEDEGYFHSVPSDDHGGLAGPEYDSQFMGRIVRIPMELSRYDQSVFDKLKSRQSGVNNPGAVPASSIGALSYQDSKMFRLLLDGANDDFNFLHCKIIDSVMLSVGTKFSRPRIVWEAHRTHDSGGVIWNTTTT